METLGTMVQEVIRFYRMTLRTVLNNLETSSKLFKTFELFRLNAFIF